MIHAHILNSRPGGCAVAGGRVSEATGLPVLRYYIAGVYHRSCEDDGGREPAGSQLPGSDVEIGATWAGVVGILAYTDLSKYR